MDTWMILLPVTAVIFGIATQIINFEYFGYDLKINSNFVASQMSRLLICELFSFQDIDTYCAVDRMTEEFGHTLLRLPPYHSAILNPIEEMWALCKNYVAMNNTRQTLKTVSILIFFQLWDG